MRKPFFLTLFNLLFFVVPLCQLQANDEGENEATFSSSIEEAKDSVAKLPEISQEEVEESADVATRSFDPCKETGNFSDNFPEFSRGETEENTEIVDIAGSDSVFIVPDHWSVAHSHISLSYKFVHEEGNRDGYLFVSNFDKTINKKDLSREMYKAATSIYGENFWEKPNYEKGYLFDDLDDLGVWVFFWHTEDQVESVLVSASPNYENSYYSNCICLINKQNKETFDFDEVSKELIKDFKKFIENIE